MTSSYTTFGTLDIFLLNCAIFSHNMPKNLSRLIWPVLIVLLIHSRLANLSWGLPYPMHPDERNMVDAVSRLSCDDPMEFARGLVQNIQPFLKTTLLGQPVYMVSGDFIKVNCANPKFFAYGQLTLYVAYFLALFIQTGSNLIRNDPNLFISENLSFQSIAISLRLISAISSMATVFVSLAIWKMLFAQTKKSKIYQYILFLFLTYTPILIQFAHFGTTESLLAFFFVVALYFSIGAVNSKNSKEFIQKMFLSSLFVGLGIAAKVSSLMFLSIPIFVLCVRYGSSILKIVATTLSQLKKLILESSGLPEGNIVLFQFESVKVIISLTIIFGLSVMVLVSSSLITAGIFSPHNVISFPEFMGSMNYESDVGMGRYVAFYTRQFLYELPLIFHLKSIFPFALGPVMSVMALVGLFFAPQKKSHNTLRFAVLIICALTMPWYAKWARFISPIYPVLVVFATMGLYALIEIIAGFRDGKYLSQVALKILVIVAILPGIGYMSIYTSQDVRYVASDWVYNNVGKGSVILSETANVIDIPIGDPLRPQSIPANFSINYISFDFYQLDADDQVFAQYQEYLKNADYIFVPSRRVFYNHTCVDVETGVVTLDRHSDKKCQLLAQSYPRLKDHYEKLFSGKLGFEQVAQFQSFPRIQIFGKTILEFPDEEAEETMTVFDHPVVRIYKKIN